MNEITKYHGVPLQHNIRLRFPLTFFFRKYFKKPCKPKPQLISAYHPLVDAQSKRIIQILKELLKTYALDHL